MAADEDVVLRSEEFEIAFKFLELDDHLPSARVRLGVVWRYSPTSDPTMTWSDESCWFGYDAWDSFVEDLSRLSAATLSDLSGNPIIVVSEPSDEPDLVVRGFHGGAYAADPPRVQVRVDDETRRTWAATMSGFAKWW